VTTLGTVLWNEAQNFATRDSWSGGIGILLSRKLVAIVCKHSIIAPDCAQLVTFQWTRILKIGVINVYGYNDTGPRTSLWNKIRIHPLPKAHYILAGDFNLIGQLEDKQGGTPTTG
jgi:hypothetical protein